MTFRATAAALQPRAFGLPIFLVASAPLLANCNNGRGGVLSLTALQTKHSRVAPPGVTMAA